MAVVLGTYALLIECWRRVLGELGGTLSFPRAAVIWLGSNLARYLPLSGWQFALMTVMARRRNVPVAVSAGASVLLAVVNVITGLVVFGLASAAAPSVAASTLWMIGLAVLLVMLAPLVVPHLGRILHAVSGREITLPTFTLRAVAIAAGGTSAAWLAYGGAFWLLARGMLPGAPSPALAPSVAVYTGAYLAGLLAIVPPAGLGAAEYALMQLSRALALFGPAEAAWLAIVVRLWRTVLEIVPGVIVLGTTTMLDRHRSDAA